jgi:hypothetical protein
MGMGNKSLPHVFIYNINIYNMNIFFNMCNQREER